MRKRRSSQWTDAEKSMIAKDYERGIRVEDIADAYGFTSHQVYRYLLDSGHVAGAAEYASFLRDLAGGFNPITGEWLPDRLIDQPQIVQALIAGAEALNYNRPRKSNPEEQQNPSAEKRPNRLRYNAGKPWSKLDDELLMTHFFAGVGTRELAREFGRSLRAIEMRLEKLLNQPSEYEKRRAMQRLTIRKE